MLPFAIPAIASFAETALQTWNRVADARAVSKAQPSVDFLALLEKASPAGAAGIAQMVNAAGSQSVHGSLASLPEVKSALSACVPGTQVNFSVSPNGELYQMLPGGGRAQVSLSTESQALLRQSTGAAGNGGSVALTLLA